MAFDLSFNSPSFNASGKFGQSLSGGDGYTATSPFSSYPLTIQAWVKCASSSNIEVAAGRSSCAWFGKAANNTALAHYGDGNAGTTDGSDITLASSVNIADGVWHFLELAVTPNGGSFFVDGVLVSSSTAKPTFPTNNQYFGVRAFHGTPNSATPSFVWNGEVDEVAVFNVGLHTASYTVPTSAYSGTEQNLVALYHLDGNGTNGVVVASNVQVAYNNASIFWSPYNWDDRSTYKVSATPGAYAKFGFTGTSVSVNVDVSAMTAASLPSASYPVIRTVIDGVSSVDTQLTSSTTAVTRSGLAAGTHTIEVFFLSTDIMNGDRWNTPVNAVRVTGFTIDPNASASPVTTRNKNAIFFGDSIWEGYLSNGTVTTQPAGNNSLLTAPPSIAQAFDCEYGVVAFSGQGYQQVGNGNVVAWPSAYSLYSAGRSRLSSGLFTPAPDYVFVEHGTNGITTSANVQAMISNLRSAAPSAKIFMLVPAGGYARAAITAGISAAADSNTYLVDLGTLYQTGIQSGSTGPNMYSLDGLHLNPLANMRVSSGYTKKIQSALDTVSQPVTNNRTVSLTLGDASGPLASLTGLKIAFFDEASPDLQTTPKYKTSSGVTSGSGVMSFTVQSTLPVGGTGSIEVIASDGRHFNGPVVVS